MAAEHTAGDGLEVLVLGAGPAYSDVPGDLGSGFLVRGGGGALVLDLGQGTFNPLAVAIEPSTLAAVAISHLHPDHFIDLVPLRHYLCRMEFQPSRRLRLIVPDGLEGRLDALYEQPGFTAAAFDLEPPTPRRRLVGPFGLEARRVRHAAWSVAYRVDPGEASRPGLVYSGDVADPDDLRPLIRPGDLLLAEATFGPGPVPAGMPHLDAPTVGRLARETGAAQVVLVHIRMGCDRTATLEAARREFGGPVFVARPGGRFRA
jgi:ribonuclease BN (tRNA processing enzyme)